MVGAIYRYERLGVIKAGGYEDTDRTVEKVWSLKGEARTCGIKWSVLRKNFKSQTWMTQRKDKIQGLSPEALI